MAFTKESIIATIAKTNCTKNRAQELVETLLETIKRTLENGEDVMISGFGKFCIQEKRERRGRNPATGTAMMLDSRRIVTFKCSGALKNRLNR